MSDEESIRVYSFQVKVNATTLQEALFFIEDFVSDHNVPDLSHFNRFSDELYGSEECIDFDLTRAKLYPDCTELASYTEIKDQPKNTGFLVDHCYIAYLNNGRIADVEQISTAFSAQENPWPENEVNLKTPQFELFMRNKKMEAHLQKNIKPIPVSKTTPQPGFRF